MHFDYVEWLRAQLVSFRTQPVIVIRLIMSFALFVALENSPAFAQQCVPSPPTGSYTTHGGYGADFGDVPLGISVIKLVSGFGAGDTLQVDFTSSLDRCSDPAFSILGTQCETYTDGRSCYAIVAFLPTTVGYHSGTLYGDIFIHEYIYPSGYVQQAIHELDTINLLGAGVLPASLDLAVTSLSVVGGNQSVPVGQPIDVDVTVAGTGFDSPENRSTAVTLNIGSNLLTQNIALSALASSPKTLRFTFRFLPTDIGPQTLTATISPSHNFLETTFSNNSSTLNLDVRDDLFSISLSQSVVYPDKTSGDNHITVQAKVAGSGPGIAGRRVGFSSTPLERSGGHDHIGNRPSGRFSKSVCITNASGICSVQYAASEIAGIENISGTLEDTLPKHDAKNLTVKIPLLINLNGVEMAMFGVTSSMIYVLSGQTDDHQSNHYLNAASQLAIFGVAYQFQSEFQAKLQLDDMSLVNGGLFDIGPNHFPFTPFWQVSHVGHREGTGVDIKKCAISTNSNNRNDRGPCDVGSIEVPKLDRFREICIAWGGHLAAEPQIHCEFLPSRK